MNFTVHLFIIITGHLVRVSCLNEPAEKAITIDISNTEGNEDVIILRNEKDTLTTLDFIPRLDSRIVRIKDGNEHIWTVRNEYEKVLSVITFGEDEDNISVVKIHREGPTGAQEYIYFNKSGGEWAIVNSNIAIERINNLEDFAKEIATFSSILTVFTSTVLIIV